MPQRAQPCAAAARERDHERRAEQHFLPAGPFARLPLRGRFSSVVWNETHADAAALLALDADGFLNELERRFTLKLGAIRVAGGGLAFLSAAHARRPGAGRDRRGDADELVEARDLARRRRARRPEAV